MPAGERGLLENHGVMSQNFKDSILPSPPSIKFFFASNLNFHHEAKSKFPTSLYFMIRNRGRRAQNLDPFWAKVHLLQMMKIVMFYNYSQSHS